MGTLEIAVLAAAAFVIGFAAGRMLSLRRNAGVGSILEWRERG